MVVNWPAPNACPLLDESCPIKNGEVYHYSLSMPVLPQYPTVSIKILRDLIKSNDI